MSIIRVGLAETKKFSEGYDAIFGKSKTAKAAKAPKAKAPKAAKKASKRKTKKK